MRSRTLWWAMAVVSAVFLLLTAVGGGFALVRRALDGDAGGVVWAAVALGSGVLFWRWILLGAWLRLRPPDGVDPTEVDPVGPWGVVGRVMIAVLVVGYVGVVVWMTAVGSEATERAEEVRDAAVRAAQDRGLTVADVEAAQRALAIESWDPAGDADDRAAYSELLDVPGGEVAAVAVQDDRASILLRTDRSPPCAVVDIVHGDLIRGRITDDC